MRSFGRFFVLVGLVWCIGIAPASAIDNTSSNTIIVTAEVLPIKSIILDSEGAIKKIISNSEKDGQLKAYLDEEFEQETFLTPEIETQYEKIKQTYNLSKIGQVYPTVTEIDIAQSQLLSEVLTASEPAAVNISPLIKFENTVVAKLVNTDRIYSLQTATGIEKIGLGFSLQGS